MASRPSTAPTKQSKLAPLKLWEWSSGAKGKRNRRIVLSESAASSSGLPDIIEPSVARPATAPPGRTAPLTSPSPLAPGGLPYHPRRPTSRSGELLAGAALLGLKRLPVTPCSAPEEDLSLREMRAIYYQLVARRPQGGVAEVGRWADAALLLLQHATQWQTSPHHLKTTALCLVFEAIVAEFPQYAGLMGLLKADLHRAIYDGFQGAAGDGLSIVIAGGTLTAGGALLPPGGRAVPFIECVAHFEEYRTAFADLQLERKRRSMMSQTTPAHLQLVCESIRQFRSAIVSAHFQLWRSVVLHRRHLPRWASVLQSVVRRHRVRLCLTAWRRWVAEQRRDKLLRHHSEVVACKTAEGETNLQDLRQQRERLLSRQEALHLLLSVKRLDGIPDEQPPEDVESMGVRVAALQETIDLLTEERRAANETSDAANRALEACLNATKKMVGIIVDTLLTLPSQAPKEWGMRTPRGAASSLMCAAIDAEREPHRALVATAEVEEGSAEDQLPAAAAHPEWLLLVWANTMLRQVDYPRTLYAFTSELCDGEKLAVLLRACFPAAFPEALEHEMDPTARVQLVLGIAHELGLNPFLSPTDVLNCHAPSNLLFLAWVFDKFIAGNHDLLRQTDRLEALRDVSGIRTMEEAQERAAELQSLLDRMLRSEAHWKAIRHHVTRHCIQVAARRTKDNTEHPTVDVRQCRRKREYSTLANNDLKTLLALPPDSVERQVLAVTKLLQRHQAEMESVHLYYVGIHGRFTKEAMALFCEDCGIESKSFPLKDTLRVYADALRVQGAATSADAPGSTGAEVEDPGLGPKAFIAALILLSEARLARDEELSTPSTRLAAFLSRFLSCACHSDLSAHKGVVYQWQMQRLVARHVSSLAKVFQQLTGHPPSARVGVDRQAFLQLFTDLDLVDGSLMMEDLCMCFAHATVEEDLHDVSGMRLPEFIEGLVAAAFFRVPSPLLPPHVRFDVFMRQHFLPAVLRHFPAGTLP
eukprot:GGOE01018038.1.p1 GENE.GGOE01018038.1~~GGOE01018038.1.p1  ORF type:complete len:986 (+),score=208.53 GGOE01018038.1:193-3150(+)